MSGLKIWSVGDPVDADDLNNNFSLIISTNDYTCGETIAVNDSLYLKASDGKVYRADGDDITHYNNWIGFAKEAGSVNNVIKVQNTGQCSGFSSLTVGSIYYMSSTSGGISLTSSVNIREVGIAVSGTKLLIFPRVQLIKKFGGTGTDGALVITSGTTTINLGGVSSLVKNYTSISITGTGKLAFTNPSGNGTIITLKSQGNVVLTSSQTPMIDCSLLGGSGGGSPNIAGQQTNANGGIGGGALYIECNGDLNFTTTNGISVAGGNGSSNTSTPYSYSIAGGGGGGGGSCVIIYNTATATSGTVNIGGGGGGADTGGNTVVGNGSSGYDGFGNVAKCEKGNIGVNGNSGIAGSTPGLDLTLSGKVIKLLCGGGGAGGGGTVGTSSSYAGGGGAGAGGAGGGKGGGAGYSLIIQNTEFI